MVIWEAAMEMGATMVQGAAAERAPESKAMVAAGEKARANMVKGEADGKAVATQGGATAEGREATPVAVEKAGLACLWAGATADEAEGQEEAVVVRAG